jgi:hypothetical protein
MSTTIRKAVPADAQVVADIFNGFVTRHATLGVKPSWTAESALQNITGEHQLVLVMVVDGKVSASFVLWIQDGVARVTASSWTLAQESVQPDPAFPFGNWMADHQTEIGATEIEAVWFKGNPFGPLMLRAYTAGMFKPTGTYTSKDAEIRQEDDCVHMIAPLDTFGKWYKQRTATFWTRMYKV